MKSEPALKPGRLSAVFSRCFKSSEGRCAVSGGLGIIFVIVLLRSCAPEHPDRFVPVSTARIQFLRVHKDGSVEVAQGFPVVSTSGADSFLGRAFDGVYNELDMRCRVRVSSGLPDGSHSEAYRILVESSRAKLLLPMHVTGEMIVSDDFVGVTDAGIPALPGVRQIRIAGEDKIKITLVVDAGNTGQSQGAISPSPNY